MLQSQANRDCFRANTPLNVVFLTDEDENNDGQNLDSISQPANLVNTARATLGNVPFMVHAIIAYNNPSCYQSEGNERASVHNSLALMTDGIVGDICANDYAGQLASISLKIQDTLKSVACLLYTSPSPRDQRGSRMPSSA